MRAKWGMVGLSFVSQKNAISKIRIQNPLETIAERIQNLYYFDLPCFPIHPKVLSETAFIVFRGRSNVQILNDLKQIKVKFPHVRLILDNDDLIWDDLLPDWNFLKPNFAKFTPEDRKNEIEWMSLMNMKTFSTPYLTSWVWDNMHKGPSALIPNTVQKALWYAPEKKLNGDIKVPRVLYSGSSTHFSNTNKLYGDWTEEWANWVIESVKNSKIEFHCIGSLPWFFEGIKHKIKVYPWTPYSSLPGLIRKIDPHFSINPLADHVFNKCKSDIKLVEASAMECVCFGTSFDNSPYLECPLTAPVEVSKDEIDRKIKDACDKSRFESMLKRQREWMETEGRWSESLINIKRWTTALIGPEALNA